MAAQVQVTIPIYTKVGTKMPPEEMEALGLIHLGDATIEVPIEFNAQQVLPFEAESIVADVEAAIAAKDPPC